LEGDVVAKALLGNQRGEERKSSVMGEIMGVGPTKGGGTKISCNLKRETCKCSQKREEGQFPKEKQRHRG